jgi:ABC-type multidrug transport system ATPase subunit
MNNDVVISFQNVSKEYKLYSSNRARLLGIFFKRVPYKKKLAVNDVSFTVKRGESVALFGKNGAGKSTILKMITGVTFPTTGEIKVNGRVSALLELTSGFDQEFSGRENIYLKGHILGLKDSEISALEEEIIEFCKEIEAQGFILKDVFGLFGKLYVRQFGKDEDGKIYLLDPGCAMLEESRLPILKRIKRAIIEMVATVFEDIT